MSTDLKRYLWACWGQALLSWRKGAVIMTVLISTVFIGGLYLGWHFNAYPTSYFLVGTGAITAFDVLAIFPYQLWKADSARIRELEESLRPKIRCSFDMNNPACVRPNTQITATDRQGQQHQTIATWYRMKVEAIGHSQFCSARLVSIKRAKTDYFSSRYAAPNAAR